MLRWFLRSFDAKLLAAFLLLAVLAVTIANLASEVVDGDTLAFDRWVMQSLRDPADPAIPIGPTWVRKALTDLTALGGGPVLTFLTLLVGGFLVASRKHATALFVVLAVAGGGLLANLLKLAFVRERPDVVPHLVFVDSASFPSAHAMNSALTFLTLGTLLARTQEDWRVKAYLMGAAILITLLIGFSRVYLGVHWPTDVLAGWIVGAAWAVICSLVARFLQRRRTIEREGEEQTG